MAWDVVSGAQLASFCWHARRENSESFGFSVDHCNLFFIVERRDCESEYDRITGSCRTAKQFHFKVKQINK